MSRFLTVDRIEFVVTYRCNSRCRHCQVGREKRAAPPTAINPEVAVRVVREVARAYAPRSVMTFGGEPLLFPETVCAIHAAARESGTGERQVITNAGWPRTEEEFRAVALRLAASGVSDIHVSVDAFHQEHIPLAVVERNVRALVDAGIGRLVWNPCWVVAEEHDNPWNERTRSILGALAQLPVERSRGNVLQPEGNARQWLGEYLPGRVVLPSGSCGDLPYTGRLDEVSSIFVEPDGSISVCDEFVIGNAAQDDIVAMLRDYDPYQIPEAKALLEKGVAGLVELARDQGIGTDPAGYYSVCDLCKSLRRRLAGLGTGVRRWRGWGSTVDDRGDEPSAISFQQLDQRRRVADG